MEEPMIDDDRRSQAPDQSAPLLEVRDLRVTFNTDQGPARAVDGVSFEVGPGEIVGIVGESGSGKSVTSLAVLGLIPAPPGIIETGSSIRYRGEELVGASEARLRSIRGNEIAMIFQEPMTALNPVQTVGAQIVESLRLHRGLKKRKAWERAVELLDEVGIVEPRARARAYPHQLSGGMRQRVMIAIALACEPALLIADEPTTALDVTVQRQILDLIGELRDRHQMGVLLITHDLGVVAETCDRVIVMYGGRVAEEGGVEEIFYRPAHPYTKGLLGAIPRLGQRVERLAVIPGTVPNATEWPAGCRFHTRCALATERCRTRAPERHTIRGDHAVACWEAETAEHLEEVE